MKTLRHWIIERNGGKERGAMSRFAEKVGALQSSVSQWCVGLVEPSDEMLPKIAKTLGINKEQLAAAIAETRMASAAIPSRQSILRDRKSAGPLMPQPSAPPIPVLGTVSAEKFRFSTEAAPGEHIYAPCPTGKDCFALKVKGSCLEPEIQDGEYIIVIKTGFVEDGQLAVVNLGEECTLKHVFYRANSLELKSGNPRIKTIKVSDSQAGIIGRVTGAFRKI